MKNTCILLILLLALVITAGCNDHRETNNKAATHVPHQLTKADSEMNDSVAVAQVEDLPEYKHIIERFNKAGKDTNRHIAILIDAEPTKATNYYQLEVGEDTPDHFVDMEL